MLACASTCDQTNVTEYLYVKGCITSELIGKLLSKTAGSNSVGVVKFLDTTALISLKDLDKAFQVAVYDKSAPMLHKTGDSFGFGRKYFLFAAAEADIYVVNTVQLWLRLTGVAGGDFAATYF